MTHSLSPPQKYKLDLPNGVKVSSLRTIEFHGHAKFDMLLGMDILTLGDLAITNCNGKTVVSFRIPPDTFHIDYVKLRNASPLG